MFKKLSFLIFLSFIFIFNSAFTVVGHRGDPINAPEETFQSFDTAFNEGADYVELDVHVSKDNVLVVSHDKNLQRITNQNYTVSQTNFATLSQLKVANGENIHSLNQIFAHYKDNPNAKFLIETKKTSRGNPQNMEALLANVIKEYGMENRVMFHTFSTKSIVSLKKYMPNIPRIFIFGTMKRLNFDILQYCDGVNVSSKLLTLDLINQLHYMHKKVFVWDEMSENPAQWNWLVNLPIDGVVTNFPGTGNKYRNLKDHSAKQTINRPMTYLESEPTPFFENPYVKNKITGYANNLDTYNVSNAIYINNEKYYEIGVKKFILANGFNNSSDIPTLLPYFNASIKSNSVHPTHIYTNPDSTEVTDYTLPKNIYYQIKGIQKEGSTIWYKIDAGWVSSKETLLKFNSKFNYQTYLNLTPHKRIINIDLPNITDYLPVSKPANNKIKYINPLIL